MEPTILADRDGSAEPVRRPGRIVGDPRPLCCTAVDLPVDKSVGKASPAGVWPGWWGDQDVDFQEKRLKISVI
jgi:hypothetical protein